MKLTAMQIEIASTQNTLRAHTALGVDAPQVTAHNTLGSPAASERIRSYYDIKPSE